MTRASQSRGKRSRRRHRRSGPIRAAFVAVLACVLLAPLLVLVPLRWVAPPTTAFMLRHERGGEDQSALVNVWTDWERISPHAALAVIAAEDQRFFDHHGFDIDSLRAAWDTARRGGSLRGASTISQQVAKNLFLWPGRSFVRKGLEAYLTLELELLWSKRRILEVYLNVAEFGDGVFGIGAASQRFFGKPPNELTEAEAALLAAVLPNPSRLHVDRPSAYVRTRQSWIRNQMGQLRTAELMRRLH